MGVSSKEIEINPFLVENTGNITRESYKSGERMRMNEFVYMLCKSRGKYFSYFF